ncbi:MAG: acetyl-CoA C-acetyltransferase [Thermoplasmata archaeon]|nr:acetyl-CoA C-acetyltransferase [Thermoplasmata archaeon]
MTDIVIASAVRTAIGKFGGTLKNIRAPELGAICIREAVTRSGLDKTDIDEVIMGNVIGAGLGQNPARQAMIAADMPVEIGAFTVNKVCGSGMKAVVLAAQAIKSGDAKAIIAGGMENMDMAPYLLYKARSGYRLGDDKIVDAMVNDGLWDIYNNYHMGNTGEIIADKFNITREDADQMAMASNQKAAAAIADGKFKEEIIPVEVKKRKKTIVIEKDAHPRAGVKVESLAKLPTVFKKKEEGGTVTPANACGITDGAAAVLLMSEEKAKELGYTPMAYVGDYTSVGVDPAYMGIAPVPATQKLLKKTKLKLSDFDLIELNEAFAVQVIAAEKELHFNMDKMNVNGGAIALGHPIGCTGTRIVVTLLHEMVKRDSKNGLATLCMSGGMGMAVNFTR